MAKNKIAIAGAGVMGASLAQVYAEAGYETVLCDLNDECLKRGKNLIALNQPSMVKAGMLTKEASDALIARISYTCDDACFTDPELSIILETIIEKLDVKQDFWEKVSRVANESCLLATNTSGLYISDIAKKMEHKERFIGQHWLNPPHLLPLCELVIGEDTSDETVSKMKALVCGLNKKPVCVKEIDGFIINRLQFALLREAMYIVDSGAATVQDIDDVMRYGMGLRLAALGPFRIADFGGLDTFEHISNYLFKELDNSKDGNAKLQSMVKEGKLGIKSGAGYYDYSGGKDIEAIKERDKLYIKLAKCLYK